MTEEGWLMGSRFALPPLRRTPSTPVLTKTEKSQTWATVRVSTIARSAGRRPVCSRWCPIRRRQAGTKEIWASGGLYAHDCICSHHESE